MHYQSNYTKTLPPASDFHSSLSASRLHWQYLRRPSKKTPVAITFCQKTDSHNAPQLIITLENAVKSDLAGIESNQIGLKSAEKMMQLMHGQLNYTQSSNFFTSTLTFKGLAD